ncbi:hypothetical protein PspLS_10306 [Pyricularia sp. CBS 133598]|nr:hypothetical protein PspLS_10306 [Pyricularia sp. CBS 133598]
MAGDPLTSAVPPALSAAPACTRLDPVANCRCPIDNGAPSGCDAANNSGPSVLGSILDLVSGTVDRIVCVIQLVARICKAVGRMSNAKETLGVLVDAVNLEWDRAGLDGGDLALKDQARTARREGGGGDGGSGREGKEDGLADARHFKNSGLGTCVVELKLF